MLGNSDLLSEANSENAGPWLDIHSPMLEEWAFQKLGSKDVVWSARKWPTQDAERVLPNLCVSGLVGHAGRFIVQIYEKIGHCTRSLLNRRP